ncbi:LytR/AlgR family response regulator transcription factor [Pedobacter nototheniae]|uniref:LytR/AlgR family response regulator transcription factor n=1 Tax=Pedobacter nototheniae TaxID=2488994 RepID=UPI00103ABD71|nr:MULTISPECIES: LytTR family DNA-binding domain-containing protein [Pedobacter]
MKYNCIVIDDDASSVNYLTELINGSEDLRLIATYLNPVNALIDMKKMPIIDILFLDVEMGEVSGLDILPLARPMAKKIIIVTAYPKYALNAFQVNADDFLLKPFGQIKFFTTVQRAIGEPKRRVDLQVQKMFYVKGKLKNTFNQMEIENLIAVEAEIGNVKLHAIKNTILGYHTIKDIEEFLEPYSEFLRVHKSFIVNAKFINSLMDDKILMTNGITIPMGKSYKKNLLSFIGDRTLKKGIS